ncbi:MAG: hypothetical protein K2P57_11205 [Burkholderiales bacterium]|nr:hypothetical protein [Burkholderiales bacterium]
MKLWSRLFVTLAITSSVFGCAVAPTPGDKPDPTPPRLHVGDKNIALWDRPGAFGPVPSELQGAGDSLCQSIGLKKAIGYHPKAEDVNGNPIKGGGYFCSN